MKRRYTNGKFLRSNGAVTVGDLVTAEEKIVALGGDLASEGPFDETINLKGALVLPGLVNAHGHSAMTLLRGVGNGLPLQRWLNEAIFPIEAKMTPDDVRAGMRWAIIEMLRGGTTCVADMYDFPWAGAEELMASGIKANICRVGLDFPWAPGTPAGRLEECIHLVRDFRDPRGRVVADFCLHSEYLTREEFVRALAEAKATFHRPVHVHVSETAAEHEACCARHGGLTPVAYLAANGILDGGAYCAHGVFCTDDDLAILREKGASLVHNPTSNLKLGSGIARVVEAIKLGVNVALGTDGCASNDNLDLFEEMHLAALLPKGLAHDPTVISASEVLAMATQKGAQALGRHDTGCLEPGWRADFCVLTLEAPHLQPFADIPNLLVYSAHASDVVMTVVDGDILYDHGEFPTIDVERARFEMNQAVRRLLPTRG